MALENVFYTSKVIWSQIDSNNHLRHSAYADLACQCRVEVLEKMGITTAVMQNLSVGPILFEERTVYRKEVPPNHVVSVTCLLESCRKDTARWSFKQEIYREDGILAAVVYTVGAWMDLKTRKLCIPPQEFATAFLEQMPRTADCNIYD